MILFITRNPPNPAGPGGSQRAMHLLRAVAACGPVDFLMLYREEDSESTTDPLDAVRPIVRHCERLEIAEWAPSHRRFPRLSWQAGQIAESLLLRSVNAPRFSRSTLARIGSLIHQRRYDAVFAARLSSARIADDLIGQGLLSAGRKVADLDDRLSLFNQRTLAARGAGEGKLRRTLQRWDINRLRTAEYRLVREWDAVSAANAVDTAALTAETGKDVLLAPNVVNRPLLAPPPPGPLRLLFVGHLSYDPNVFGLQRFLDEGWPEVRRQLPDARFDIVGMRPKASLVDRIGRAAASLHADVESVEPFYAASDIVVAPIWEGGGTRIKILEAMAFGRPVVSTSIGAEGLGLVSGEDAIIADAPLSLANGIVRLARDAALRSSVVARARQRQLDHFSEAAIERCVRTMIEGGGSQ